MSLLVPPRAPSEELLDGTLAPEEAEASLADIERVHRLHGATRYCGVPQLRAACQRSETLLKQQDPRAYSALEELDRAIRMGRVVVKNEPEEENDNKNS